jgi:hypothetical protein
MNASKELVVMDSARRSILLSVTALVVMAALASACWAKDPCGEGMFLLTEGNCAALPGAADAAPESGPLVALGNDGGDAASDGGDGGSDATSPVEAAATSSFGKTCAAMTDCGGDAPICGAPQLPYCTQINCQPGEANAGACPADFTCITPPGYPSVCLKN